MVSTFLKSFLDFFICCNFRGIRPYEKALGKRTMAMYCDLKSVRGILILRKMQNFNNLKQNVHKQDHCSNENILSISILA